MSEPGRSRLGNAAVVALLAGLAGWHAVSAWRSAEPDPRQWGTVAFVLVVYAGLCAGFLLRGRWRRPTVDASGIPVVYATQTGFAEELAQQTAIALHAAGHATRLLPLSHVDERALGAARMVFLVVATYGDGEAPDPARRFARELARRAPSLPDLRYGLLMLGDRRYPRFCGFGHALDAWLRQAGATPAFPAIEVDDGQPEALVRWRTALRPWTGTVDDVALADVRFSPWRLVARREANPGSFGQPAFHLALEPVATTLPAWEAGDIAVVRLPDGDQREYSIASIPADGRIELLVRRTVRPDGRQGEGARWMTEALAEGGETALHVRANRGFRLEGVAPATPLLLIGNGTGIAGLRAHLKTRAAAKATRNWLVFGERQAAVDRFHGDELDAWAANGVLSRVDFAWSRDGATKRYVQDVLRDAREDVVRFVADDAVILVCGSATGMADGVDRMLADILGVATLDTMAADGRYRRDVY